MGGTVNRGERFAGRVCVVTAASSGIGASVAAQLEAEGARVWRLDKQPDPDGTLPCDVTSDASVDAARLEILRGTPAIDHVYNGVGMLPPRPGLPLEQEDLADWRRVFDTNLYSMVRVLRAFAPSLVTGGSGSVVNMSSDQSLSPQAGALAYAASKAAVNALTAGLARQWIGRGIRVNAVAPGAVRSGFIDPVAGTPERRDAMFAHADRARPLGLASPDVTARAVLFLLSDDARHITGEVWRCDSGQSLMGVRL